ncbi:hypothetical protein DNTS_004461, partial [Danionella cerebrum]
VRSLALCSVIRSVRCFPQPSYAPELQLPPRPVSVHDELPVASVINNLPARRLPGGAPQKENLHAPALTEAFSREPANSPVGADNAALRSPGKWVFEPSWQIPLDHNGTCCDNHSLSQMLLEGVLHGKNRWMLGYNISNRMINFNPGPTIWLLIFERLLFDALSEIIPIAVGTRHILGVNESYGRDKSAHALVKMESRSLVWRLEELSEFHHYPYFKRRNLQTLLGLQKLLFRRSAQRKEGRFKAALGASDLIGVNGDATDSYLLHEGPHRAPGISECFLVPDSYRASLNGKSNRKRPGAGQGDQLLDERIQERLGNGNRDTGNTSNTTFDGVTVQGYGAEGTHIIRVIPPCVRQRGRAKRESTKERKRGLRREQHGGARGDNELVQRGHFHGTSRLCQNHVFSVLPDTAVSALLMRQSWAVAGCGVCAPKFSGKRRVPPDGEMLPKNLLNLRIKSCAMRAHRGLFVLEAARSARVAAISRGLARLSSSGRREMVETPKQLRRKFKLAARVLQRNLDFLTEQTHKLVINGGSGASVYSRTVAEEACTLKPRPDTLKISVTLWIFGRDAKKAWCCEQNGWSELGLQPWCDWRTASVQPHSHDITHAGQHFNEREELTDETQPQTERQSE